MKIPEDDFEGFKREADLDDQIIADFLERVLDDAWEAYNPMIYAEETNCDL